MYLQRFTAAFGGILLLSATGVSAADFQQDYFQLLDPAPVHDWSGLYVGGYIGYGSGDSSNSWSPTSAGPWAADGDISYESLTGGLYAGYQYQFGNFVIGAEGELGTGRFRGDDSQFAGFVNEIEINTFGTVRARVGLASDRFMVYATGGVAAAEFYKRDLTNNFSGRSLATGWTAGAGVEMALNENLSARAEYQYIRFDPVETGVIAAGGGGYMHRTDDPAMHVVKLGLSYAF